MHHFVMKGSLQSTHNIGRLATTKANHFLVSLYFSEDKIWTSWNPQFMIFMIIWYVELIVSQKLYIVLCSFTFVGFISRIFKHIWSPKYTPNISAACRKCNLFKWWSRVSKFLKLTKLFQKVIREHFYWIFELSKNRLLHIL